MPFQKHQVPTTVWCAVLHLSLALENTRGFGQHWGTRDRLTEENHHLTFFYYNIYADLLNIQ